MKGQQVVNGRQTAMAPKASGASQQRAQPTISHFFSQANATPSASNKRTRSPVDLTLDSDDEEPPSKRVKLPESHDRQNIMTRQTTTTPKHDSPMKKKYKYISLEESPPKAPTLEDERAKKVQEARRKFLKQTLRQTNGVGRSSPVRSEEPGDSSAQSDQEADSEANDDITEKLHERFASKVAVSTKRNSGETSTKGKKQKKEQVGPSGKPYTPLELQVKQLKEENPGTLLLFEVGYKYRFFGEDARAASKALGIACWLDRNFLTGSIPVHRKLVHTKKLLSLGHRVGVVGQTETAALKKVGDNKSGPFARQVTELYTAATFVDEMEDIDAISGGSLGAALLSLSEQLMGGMGADERVKFGLISVSPTTGEVIYDEFTDTAMRPELETRLAHIRPFELLLPGSKLSKHSERMLAHYATKGSVRIERVDDELDYTAAFEFLRKFYEDDEEIVAASSSTFKKHQPFADIIGFPKGIVIALAHAVRHLLSYGLSGAFKRTSFFANFLTRSHMLLNANTLENLEIFQNQTDETQKGSLIWILDRTLTRFGSRQLRSWVSRPLVNERILQERFDAVDEILQSPSADIIKLRTLLKGLPDLAKGLCRIQYGKSNPKEVATVLTALSRIANTFEPRAKPSDAGFKSELLNDIVFTMPHIREAVKGFLEDMDLKKAREGEITELWASPEKYPEVEDIRFSIHSVDINMNDHLKEVRKVLRRPGLNWASVSGVDFLIEVPNADKAKVPANWNRVQGTKKVTRFHTPEARKAISEREQYKETLVAVATKAFQKFQAEISSHYNVLRDVVNKLGIADALISLALVATRPGYVRPQIIAGSQLNIVQGRHPMVEDISSSPFVPNNIRLGGDGQRAIVITGPNMGGKSSLVKMTALLVIMAQIGCYVPAESAEVSIHDAVLTRMGASDEIMRGKSTFMVELSETAEIVRSATEKSLVILDELGRGTATYDGVAIASSVLEHAVLQMKCKTLFTTHYPQIGVELSQQFPALVANAHMAYMEEELIDGRHEIHFLYKLKQGVAVKSFGVECGRLAGLPEVVLSLAAQKSKEHEEAEHSNRLARILKELARSVKSEGVSQEKTKELMQKIMRSNPAS